MKKENLTLLEDHIKKAKEGKQTSFNYLLDTFWNEVYNFQLKRTHNEYEAEDITIQSFSRAFDKINTFKEEYNFKTWLIQISKNIHIDLLRKKNASIRSKTTTKVDDSVYKIIDANPTPEDKLITEQNLAQLLLYIKQLKPNYQKVINLRYFQELSYKEIAEQLNEPINNVKIKLLRAKKLLAEIITNAKQKKLP
ncbi:RNA polymerase sigma factor [Aquimarina muelleri]|uniref:DNA-directed RNA polymerase sigma-70 factor n=1 Tax=Aquimarina muelleri TaxID=279356 RepID=A0A918N2Q0_9FLAO|nr:sigma-70 family RNA polymerase sigma factor [Aquimarina muelleri]MCX2762512.1 sigma-70 family RNA polymerase sigma factor [Aquimarina muelleri]GGX20345.1 DNA-directed RNA polymerase sigma-70 factor [Aquimarina muelleri]